MMPTVKTSVLILFTGESSFLFSLSQRLPVTCWGTQRRKKDGQRARGQQIAKPRAVSFMFFDNCSSSRSYSFHLLMNILAFNHRYHFIETFA
ncbi:mCG1036785, isoform CRA_b [Mus musculus]|nr:mCG1036785, isoform CRA_b [Mus musculus]